MINRCVLCKREEESVDHIFIHCIMAQRVWCFFLSRLGIAWVFPNHFKFLLSVWRIR